MAEPKPEPARVDAASGDEAASRQRAWRRTNRRAPPTGSVPGVGTIAGLAELNEAPAEEAERGLLACCAAPRWAAVVMAGRPYADLAALHAMSDAALAALDWGDIEQALAAHPRIGERAQGAGREADWSRREQSAAATGDAAVRAALTAGNVEYEQRFGHVFLVCATGRSAAEILAALQGRLGNDEATERGVVRDELAKIVRLRLARLAGSGAGGAAPPGRRDREGAGIGGSAARPADADATPEGRAAAVSTHVLDAARGQPAAGLAVRLERRVGDGAADAGGWRQVAGGHTDADGRLGGWAATPGTHRLVFDTGSYLGEDAFYPEVVITFRISGAGQRYHVPLLLSPFAYSTYRGS